MTRQQQTPVHGQVATPATTESLAQAEVEPVAFTGLLSGAPIAHGTAVRGRYNALLAIQRHQGNRAAQAVVQQVRKVPERSKPRPVAPANHTGETIGTHDGLPLDNETRTAGEAIFHQDFGHVRLHTGAEANASARALEADAYTVGQNIVFGPGQYDPASLGGRWLLTHELAHVAQQRGQGLGELQVGADSDSLEQEASAAPAVTMAGARPAISPGPVSIRRFKQGNDRRPGGHAWMTSQALQHTMKLSPEAAHQGRLGNWERDLSQAITPGVVAILQEEGIFAILNIMAIEEFGRGLDPAEFGTYDPVEHIDNPAGLRASDVYQQGSFGADGNSTPGNPDISGTALPVAGGESEAYADKDVRYSSTATTGKVMNPSDAQAYQVDQSGIPVYMNTSREWLKRSLRGAARSGRSGSQGRGPRDFASGIHVMQDFYAHSNFVEIAINLLIRSGTLQVLSASNRLERVAPNNVLDTRVHANDAHGEPVAENLAFAGREVMATGSFNLTDTAASLLEELKDKVIDLNPFAEKSKGPSQLTSAVLDYLDMKGPTDFSETGQALAGLIRPVAETVAGMGSAGASVVEGVGGAGGSLVSGLGALGAEGLRAMSWLNGKLGGDANYFEREAQTVAGASHDAGATISGAANATGQGIRTVTNGLNVFANGLARREHLLRELYGWISGIDFLAPIKATARNIPVVGERVAQAIEMLQQQLREEAEKHLGKAWNEAAKAIVAAMNRAIARVRAETNLADKKNSGRGGGLRNWAARKFGAVGDMYDTNGHLTNGIAPTSYTPPSHTEIAKDHGDMTGPVRDRIADSENHEHADGDATSEGNEPSGHEHEAGEDTHGHVHISAWLNPIAERLAAQATHAIGARVSAVWDKVDRGQPVTDADLDAIDKEIDRWFSHPSDSEGLWRQTVVSMVSSRRFGPELLHQLAERRAQTPHTPNGSP